MKYFVLSLHRVGTQSTHSLLSQWGLRAAHYPLVHNAIDLKLSVRGHERNLDHVFSVMRPVFDAYDAVSDIPTTVLYRQLAVTYPNAKFLLMHRDPIKWAHSIRRHLGSKKFTEFERVVYWHFFGNKPAHHSELSDLQLAQMHAQHVKEVTTFFAPQEERLGAFCLTDPSLAENISRFVGRRILPFPHRGASSIH